MKNTKRKERRKTKASVSTVSLTFSSFSLARSLALEGATSEIWGKGQKTEGGILVRTITLYLYAAVFIG